MSLYNILLKIVQKCQIKTRKDGAWTIREFPDGSWEAIRTAYDDVAPDRWSAWGSLYYATLYNWQFPSGCQNPKTCRVQSYDGDGATWITLKGHSASGLNGIYAITSTSNTYATRVYVTIEISGGY